VPIPISILASTLAFDADTGKIVWHYQETPADVWDYDGVNEQILVDRTIDGKRVPALLKASRNGFFYVLNRETGKQRPPHRESGEASADRQMGQGCVPERLRRQELGTDVLQP